MTADTDTPTPPATPPPSAAPGTRLPSRRAGALLATLMLSAGVAVGAAIGPAPDASFAGGPAGMAGRLPALLATLAERAGAQRAAAAAAIATPAATATETSPRPVRRRRRRHRRTAGSASTPIPSAPAAASTPSTEEQEAKATPHTPVTTKTTKLPSTTSVWLIELAGGTFAEALAKPAAAPYITGQLLPGATYLGSWSALSASAFASAAALAEPTAPGATPPLMHSIVQPPCPEGAAGAPCAPETPSQLAAADEFLKSTLAQITATPAYREHGLVVVTFATVAVASEAGLAPGSSAATLTSQPPAGAVLLSPFANAGAKPAIAFNPTSPRQSLEKLLR